MRQIEKVLAHVSQAFIRQIFSDFGLWFQELCPQSLKALWRVKKGDAP